MPERRAIFLDRDGVINEDRGYVGRIADFAFLPGVFEALRIFSEAGHVLVVVTNQSGIGRGYFSQAAFDRLNRHMISALAVHDIPVEAVYHCPHHPEAASGQYRVVCSCRKPQPGMIRQAAQELGIDLAGSSIVGDKPSDLEAGRRAGVGLRVLLRSMSCPTPTQDVSHDAIFPDLLAFVRSGIWT